MDRDVNIQQKILNPPNGIMMLIILLAASIFSVVGFIYGVYYQLFGIMILCVLLWIVLPSLSRD